MPRTGRPRKSPSGCATVAVSIPREQLARLDELATRYGLSRSETTRQILERYFSKIDATCGDCGAASDEPLCDGCYEARRREAAATYEGAG